MKRNRLLRSSTRSNVFSNDLSHRRHRLIILSLLTFIGIFITTIGLATSQPTMNNQTVIVDLPALPAKLQTSHRESQFSYDQLALARPTASVVDIVTESKQPTSIHTLSTQAVTDSLIENKSLSASATANIELLWKDIVIKPGDNLSLIFPRVGLSARDVYDVVQSGSDAKPLLNLKPGQTMRFGFKDQQYTQLQQVELKLDPLKTLLITATEQGYDAITLIREVESRQVHTAGVIKSSLFEAGIEAGLSDKLVMELAYIFGWDIDFALDLRQNDQFRLIYEEAYLDGEKISDGDILAAEFINQGTSYKALRYTDETGISRYYSPNGESMRKTFSRTPVHFSRISSKFNPNRKHPILKTDRPHRGVDYAAATGTPILATGDGKVEFIGTKGGYGRTIILSHGSKYTTLYAHMSRFKKGIKRGQRIQQGDTIGYIGSSGLATGPHLHYEFRVNGVHRNPLTVALPKAEPLPTKYLADFQQKSEILLTQLNQINNNVLAFNN